MKGVYKIESPTGKIYIGSTNNFKRRCYEYKSLKCKEQTRLYNSLNKYGYNNHIVILIEECNNLYERERYWQEYYNSIGKKGLNCLYVNTEEKIRIVSKHTRKLMSKAMTGRGNPRWGVKLSQETKNKISKSNIGKIQCKKLNKKQAERMMGNTISILSKEVINIKTGIIYKSIRKAAIATGINYSTLKKYLLGSLKNKTNLKYK